MTFVVDDCTVTVDNNIANGTLTASKTTADSGEEISLTVTPAEHYKLKTLTVKDSKNNPVTVTNNKFTMPDSDVTVTAEFEQITYTVHYDAGEGTGTMTGQTVGEGDFAWSDSTIKPAVSDSETTEYDVTFTPDDTNLSPVSFKLKVKVNKADPAYTAPTGLKATYGQTLADVNLPDGWAWADNTQKVGNAGTNTFKANYTPADTDNYNTAENVDVSVTVEKAPQEAPTADQFTVTNETAAGKSDGKIDGLTDKMEISTSAEDGFTAVTEGSGENLAPGTYYVRFAEDENHTASEATALTINAGRKLIVKFVNEDGTELFTADYNYNDVPEYTGETPKKAADAQYTYTFKGWDKELGAVTENTTYTATYDSAKNSYTITFDTDGGSEIAPITKEWGTAITAPVNPTKEGYIFAGWDTEIPATMPTENITIKAKWVTNVYTVTINNATVNDVEWVHGSTTPLFVVVNGTPDDTLTFDFFEALIVDGETVDSSNYTGEKGSLKLTINADFLNTLAVGEHTMQIVFRDNTAECRLTILPEPVVPQPEDTFGLDKPTTGNNFGVTSPISGSTGTPAASGESASSGEGSETTSGDSAPAADAPAPGTDTPTPSDNPATGVGDPLGALALVTAASLAALDLITKKRRKED